MVEVKRHFQDRKLRSGRPLLRFASRCRRSRCDGGCPRPSRTNSTRRAAECIRTRGLTFADALDVICVRASIATSQIPWADDYDKEPLAEQQRFGTAEERSSRPAWSCPWRFVASSRPLGERGMPASGALCSNSASGWRSAVAGIDALGDLVLDALLCFPAAHAAPTVVTAYHGH